MKRKGALRRVVKQIEKQILAGDKAKAGELLSQLMKAADKAAKTGVIHPNKAARIKSRLMRKLKGVTR